MMDQFSENAAYEGDLGPTSAPVESPPQPQQAGWRATGTDGLFQPRAQKRKDMADLFARAMSGLLPRDRALEKWEPDVLDERHMQVVMLRSTGLDQRVIAKLTGYTESWVSVILNHPDAQYLLTMMLSYAAD